VFNNVDSDGDGLIDFGEFKQIMLDNKNDNLKFYDMRLRKHYQPPPVMPEVRARPPILLSAKNALRPPLHPVSEKGLISAQSKRAIGSSGAAGPPTPSRALCSLGVVHVLFAEEHNTDGRGEGRGGGARELLQCGHKPEAYREEHQADGHAGRDD
jgi:hypothetical protein